MRDTGIQSGKSKIRQHELPSPGLEDIVDRVTKIGGLIVDMDGGDDGQDTVSIEFMATIENEHLRKAHESSWKEILSVLDVYYRDYFRVTMLEYSSFAPKTEMGINRKVNYSLYSTESSWFSLNQKTFSLLT